MPYRHKNFVLSDQSAVTVRIYAGEISGVVPVRLEEPNYLVFKGEEIQVGRLAGIDWPVVTDFVSAADRVSRIKTVPAVGIVSLPRWVGRLHQNIGMAGIIAYNKN